MFGRYFFTKRSILKQFSNIARDSVGEDFSVKISFKNNLVSEGRNFIDGNGVFCIELFAGDIDIKNPNDLFELSRRFFHELSHVEHHVKSCLGEGFSDDMKPITLAYLSREMDDYVYASNYNYNVFECDAEANSVVRARDFCGLYFTTFDFDELSVDVFMSRFKFFETDFVNSLKECETAEDVSAVIQSRKSVCLMHSASRCREDSLMGLYLRTEASDRFLDVWLNSDTIQDRDVLMASVCAIKNKDVALNIAPDVDDSGFFVGDFDAYRDVLENSGCFNRSYVDIISVKDIALIFCDSFFDRNYMPEIRSVRTHSNIETVDKNGYHITYTSLDSVGKQPLFLSFEDDAVSVLNRTAYGLKCGYLYKVQGEYPSVVNDYFDNYSLDVQKFSDRNIECIDVGDTVDDVSVSSYDLLLD